MFKYSYNQLFEPTIRALKQLGGSGSIDEIEETIIEILQLTEAEINDIHRGNTTKLEYRLAWARTYLKRYGLLDNSARGVWVLTEKGLKDQYTAQFKKLSFSQGKLLIRLVDRECNQSSYELIKAFMGSFRAGFYQTFASLFGASLKKEYDSSKDDSLTERVITLAENGQI